MRTVPVSPAKNSSCVYKYCVIIVVITSEVEESRSSALGHSYEISRLRFAARGMTSGTKADARIWGLKNTIAARI